MVERGDGQLDPCHAAHLFGPQARGVDHMLCVDGAFFGHHVPAVRGLDQVVDVGVFNHFRAVFLGRPRIGVHGACGVDIAFAIGPHAAQNALGGHDGVERACFLGGDEADVVNADGLERAVGRLQPFPAVGRACKGHAARHVHAHGLA
jgi:hypothetical protein